MAPPVLVTMGDYQTVSLGSGLKAAVVVGVAPAAILYAVLVVEVMHHFVKQGRSHFLDGAGQCPGSYVDFVGAAQLGNPGIFPQGKMTVSAGRGLNGDRRP